MITTAIALVFGALASRSTGIYFLMITLTFAVIANLFFGQVTTSRDSAESRASSTPEFIGNVASIRTACTTRRSVTALFVYVAIRYVVRTPFGVALQGVRDEPVRMASLGYNVPLHRTMAFGFAGFLASFAGVLYVWWNGQIDPASIGIASGDRPPGDRGHRRPLPARGSVARRACVRRSSRTTSRTSATEGLPVVGGTFNTLIGSIFL